MKSAVVAANVTRFKGFPIAVQAALREAEDGGLAVNIINSALSWEVSSKEAANLAPFFDASERRLDIDRMSDDPRKTTLRFTFVADGYERTVSVPPTSAQGVGVH